MPSDHNFNYYTTHDFHSNDDRNDFASHLKSFPALNCYVRSLQGNHEHLVHMLSELQSPFSLMRLSKIKFNVDKDIITNVNIPGYDFISQPSLSNAEGVGFYKVSTKQRLRTQDLINFKSINTKETVC